MSAYFSLEECTSTIRVYNQGSCFKTPTLGYNNHDFCKIFVHQDIRLHVEYFSLEPDWDWLLVNKIKYSGSNGPEYVLIEAGEHIIFSADFSVRYSGFDICGVALTSSDSSSGTDISVAPLAFGIIACGCVVLAIFIRYWPRKQQIEGNVLDWRHEEDLVAVNLPEEAGVGIMTWTEQSVEGAVDDRCNKHLPSDYSMSFNFRPEFSSSENCYPVLLEAQLVMTLSKLEEEEENIGPSFTSLQLDDIDSSELAPPGIDEKEETGRHYSELKLEDVDSTADIAPPDDLETPPSYVYTEEIKQLEGEEGAKPRDY